MTWKEPFLIKNLTLRNRIVLPPMATEKSNHSGNITSQVLEYYRKMSLTGVGLIILEHNYIHPMGRCSPNQMSIQSDLDIAFHSELTSAIHENNTPVICQISHAGSNRLAAVFHESIGPSEIPHPVSGLIPTACTRSMLEELKNFFCQAAIRVQKAGYDGVEIHSAHGYLLSQFLSPLTNQRKDEYGGSWKNRVRLLTEILSEVRSHVGNEYPIFVRMGVSDTMPFTKEPNGLTIDDAACMAGILEEADCLDISGGMCGSRPSTDAGEGYFLPFAQKIRASTTKPVLLTGGFVNLSTVDSILDRHLVDLIGVGRSIANNPNWLKQQN
ncbi:NADH:flavin oxidoreductase [bacterium]|nr:NADH:flavin oxidoreductase [bacterium]